MASIRGPVLRNIFSSPPPLSRCVQRRWAQVHDVRFLATHRDPRSVQDKYREKLEQKAREEGHSSISSLKEAYKDKIESARAKATIPNPDVRAAPTPTSQPAGQPSSAAKPATSPTSSPAPGSTSIPKTQTPGIKPLSSYLDIPKILTLPQKEIETLWRLRHAQNPLSICATIPLDTYTRMISTAKQNPQFVLPLPRTSDTPTPEEEKGEKAPEQATPSTGADMHFLQWGFHPPATEPGAPNPVSVNPRTANNHTSTVLFTHLGAYKMHGSYSQPHTVITHHLDLADEKGLVLMQGSVVADRGVSVEEAKWLVMWLQRFYDWGVEGKEGGRKAEILKMFSRGDTKGFKVEELMEEVERV